MAHAHEGANFCGNDGEECHCGHQEEKAQQPKGSCGAEGKECHCSDGAPSQVSLGARIRPYTALIITLLLVCAFAAFATWTTGYFDWHIVMQYFMAGYFLAFGILQTISLKKSARMVQQYDKLAQVAPWYGYVYPPLQIALGVAYLFWISPIIVNAIAATVLFFTFIGVIDVLESKKKVRCGCLGQTMNVKVGWVTFAENGIMFLMAAGMLVYFFATMPPAGEVYTSPSGHQHKSF